MKVQAWPNGQPPNVINRSKDNPKIPNTIVKGPIYNKLRIETFMQFIGENFR